MVVRGRVRNGVVVLDDLGRLPEGAEVRVEMIAPCTEAPPGDDGQTLAQKLLKHAGTCRGLLSDLADQHDHYIHGTPKK